MTVVGSIPQALARRSSLLPAVPTIEKAGVAGFDYPIWYGLWAPTGTPAVVINKLAEDIARAMPELRDWLAEHGADPMSMTQAEFARFVLSESEDAARIIKAAGIAARVAPPARILSPGD